MVFEIVDKEHVPQDSSVIAGATYGVVVTPNRAIPEVWCYLPENENRQHVGRPDSDESMEDCPEVEFGETLDLFELLKHTHRDEEPSDPEEGVDGEVGRRGECGDPWSGQDVEAFSPVLDVGESKPLVVPVNDPADGQYPGSVQKQ